MDTYIIVKSILMLAALIGAFSVFFLRVRRLYRLMRAVEGRSNFTFNRVKERLTVLLTDVLGQSSRTCAAKPCPGLRTP